MMHILFFFWLTVDCQSSFLPRNDDLEKLNFEYYYRSIFL